MARKYIGRILSGGVMVLCVVLLFTPETHSQGFRAVKKQYTISGEIGLPGVTMQGLPEATQTDENGVYTARVDHGWSGTVRPVKRGYTFEPKERAYPEVKENKTEEHYQANPVTFTISGSTGVGGVRLVGLPDDPVSDENGRYSATVNFGWSNTVTPVKEGYRFEPVNKVYDQVTAHATTNYRATELTYTISGNAGAEEVVMKGLPGDPRTDRDGKYNVEVKHNWSGTVMPTKDGHTFEPRFTEYSQVTMSATDNYSARVQMFQISGSAGQSGVTMEGFPSSVQTDETGYYTTTVKYGWKGEVTPVKAGYTFTPESKPYTKVTSDQLTDNYTAELMKLKISGNVRMAGVTLEGFDTQVVSEAGGYYSTEVEWGWSGTVRPVKRGYGFEPSHTVYPSLTTDQINQNYVGTPITFTIAGNVGLSQVRLEGLPGQPVFSEEDGSYSAKVGYEWSGVVTPKKTGYTFDPNSRTYTEMLADATAEDYGARINLYTLAGRVIDDKGGVANVAIYASDTVDGSAMTGSDGSYELVVEHGWQGQITPDAVGYSFAPKNKSVGPVYQGSSTNDFVAKVRMLSITDSVVIGNQPIQDVLITAQPGDYTATTDAKGKFTIKVPYGWTGSLTAEKEAFDFEGQEIPFTNVTDDIDNTVTTAPPVRQPTEPVRQETEPVRQETEPVELVQQATAGQTELERLRAELEETKRLMTILAQGGTLATGQGEDVPITPPGPVDTPRVAGPPVSGNFVGQDLVDVLVELSKQANIPVWADRTVKRGATTVNIQLDRTPLESALESMLESEYDFRKKDNGYQVYRPVTQMFNGEDLGNTVLPLIAATAGVPIVSDATVMGEVYQELDALPLEEALDILVAGTPFVWVEMPNYYLVGSRSIIEPEASAITYSDVFPEITETRAVYLNYITPLRAKELISGAFNRYVMADPDPNSHYVTVTAPRSLANRIVSDLKQIDTSPRQVLLDARVVVMERTDLLDIGIEWGFPQISAGAFTDGYVNGEKLDGDVTSSWVKALQIGYSPDRAFTDSLLMALNLLEQNGQADIVSNPQVLALDGQQSQIKDITEEHYVLTSSQSENFYVQAEFVTIMSGTTLTITPRIMDNNDIMLEMAVEVSESAAQGQESDLPVVTRRMTRNRARISDGGTVALAGLTETRAKLIEKRVPGLSKLPLIGGLFRNTESDQSTKEIAVFVTAQLVPDGYRTPTAPSTTVEQRMPTAPTATDYREQLRRSLADPSTY